MSRYVRLPSGRKLVMADVATLLSRGADDAPVHMLWPRKTLGRQPSRSPSVRTTALRRCTCSVDLVRLLIWATRNARHGSG